jgi:multisubunit Na+/H+ antiporter MnhE subunit
MYLTDVTYLGIESEFLYRDLILSITFSLLVLGLIGLFTLLTAKKDIVLMIGVYTAISGIILAFVFLASMIVFSPEVELYALRPNTENGVEQIKENCDVYRYDESENIYYVEVE